MTMVFCLISFTGAKPGKYREDVIHQTRSLSEGKNLDGKLTFLIYI